MRSLVSVAALASAANAYFLVGNGHLTTQRLDPIVSNGTVSSHAHFAVGGSNFAPTVSTAQLRQSQCTSFGIKEDKSVYWWPQLYFQWKNGSFTSVNGGSVIYYLFSDTPGVTTPFPDDFRMISGNPLLRTYDASSYAQQAVTFLCLDFQGTSTRYNQLPAIECPSGIRSQLNFQSCWDGVNSDSADHKSHVDYLSGGPDSGTCSNPKFPKTLPRIFTEVYWSTQDFDSVRDQAMNSSQPFVFAQGDDTGYGYHGDYAFAWEAGVLQKVVDGCNCNIYGDATCCANKGIFTLNTNNDCQITNTWDEQTLGTIPKLPGNNPVQHFGKTATAYPNNYLPPRLSPVYAYTGNTPPGQGSIVAPGSTIGASPASTPAASPATGPLVNLVVPSQSSQGSISSSVSPVPTVPPVSSSVSMPPVSTPVPEADDGCGDSDGTPMSMPGSLSGLPSTQTADATSTTPTPPPVDVAQPPPAGSSSGLTPSVSPLSAVPMASGASPVYTAIRPTSTLVADDGTVHHDCTCTCYDSKPNPVLSGSYPNPSGSYSVHPHPSGSNGMHSYAKASGSLALPSGSPALPSSSPAVEARSLRKHLHRRMHNAAFGDEFY